MNLADYYKHDVDHNERLIDVKWRDGGETIRVRLKMSRYSIVDIDPNGVETVLYMIILYN